MRPEKLQTKIFLDSGNPAQTRETLDLLGFLDGQTTNPSLFVKNPEVQERVSQGEKFDSAEINNFYRKIVTEISDLIPEGSVSVEVYADKDSSAKEIVRQSRDMNSWIPNAHIKLPITKAGLEAANQLVGEGIRVNMTLCFAQEQAAAVHAATRGAGEGQVYISPFIGRLDDRGENGVDLIKNIHNMYLNVNSHVELLAASTRSYEHHIYCLQLGIDRITSPFQLLKEWVDGGMWIPDDSFVYDAQGLKPIEYIEFDLEKDWSEYDIGHSLTDAGLQKFADDWNELIK